MTKMNIQHMGVLVMVSTAILYTAFTVVHVYALGHSNEGDIAGLVGVGRNLDTIPDTDYYKPSDEDKNSGYDVVLNDGPNNAYSGFPENDEPVGREEAPSKANDVGESADKPQDSAEIEDKHSAETAEEDDGETTEAQQNVEDDNPQNAYEKFQECLSGAAGENEHSFASENDVNICYE
jgi:hypothetical protein